MFACLCSHICAPTYSPHHPEVQLSYGVKVRDVYIVCTSALDVHGLLKSESLCRQSGASEVCEFGICGVT